MAIAAGREAAHRDGRARWLVAAGSVFGVALALRVAHLVFLRESFRGTGLFSLPLGDAAFHWQEALDILDKDFWLRDRVPWKGPGYSYFLAALIAVLGRSLARVRFALAALGAANCAALTLLARRVLPLRWAVAAGLLASLDGLLVAYDVEPYFPALLVALSLPVMFLLADPEAGWRAHAGAGLSMGLACLVHPVYVIPAALLTLWTARRSLRRAAALALAAAAAIAPVTVKNLVAQGQPVLISWNGGVNLYVANHPTFDQLSGNQTNAWARIMQTPLDAGIETGQARDRLYYGLAFRQALRYPRETLAGFARKAAIFFSPVEYANNLRLYDLGERSPVARVLLGHWGPLWVPFGVLGPLAVVGLSITLRRPSPLGTALALWALGILVSVVLSFNTARYRAPVAFFSCLWAAVALAAAADAVRRRDGRALALGAVAAGVLAVAMAASAVPQKDQPPSFELQEAIALTPKGPFEEFDRWAGRALERDPASPATLMAVSDLYARWGKRDLQRTWLRRLLALPDLEPDTVDLAEERLAGSYATEGRFYEARAELLAALSIHADDAVWRGYPYYAMGLGPMRSCWLRLELAEVELRLGESAQGRKLIDKVRGDCPSGPRFRATIGELERQYPPVP